MYCKHGDPLAVRKVILKTRNVSGRIQEAEQVRPHTTLSEGGILAHYRSKEAFFAIADFADHLKGTCTLYTLICCLTAYECSGASAWPQHPLMLGTFPVPHPQ